jgi:hypothetical protein
MGLCGSRAREEVPGRAGASGVSGCQRGVARVDLTEGGLDRASRVRAEAAGLAPARARAPPRYTARAEARPIPSPASTARRPVRRHNHQAVPWQPTARACLQRAWRGPRSGEVARRADGARPGLHPRQPGPPRDPPAGRWARECGPWLPRCPTTLPPCGREAGDVGVGGLQGQGHCHPQGAQDVPSGHGGASPTRRARPSRRRSPTQEGPGAAGRGVRPGRCGRR